MAEITPEELERIETRWNDECYPISASTLSRQQNEQGLAIWAENYGLDLIAALRAAWKRERWIPVEERLPDHGHLVEIGEWYGEDLQNLACATYHVDYKWEGYEGEDGEYKWIPTHWREIRPPEAR